MLKINAIFFMVFSLACVNVAFAHSIPDPILSSVCMPNLGDASPAIFILPSGEGSAFSEAQIVGNGAVVDATIELILVDTHGSLMINFPMEDIWLVSPDGGIESCFWGTKPDQPTNSSGVTFWSSPMLRIAMLRFSTNSAPFFGQRWSHKYPIK